MAENSVNYEIHNALYCGDIDKLQSLLTAGQSVNHRTQKGNTLLVSAMLGHGSKQKKASILELLIKHGADINAVNEDGDSILHVAVKVASRQTISKTIIQRLIDHGADTRLVNNSGQTAIQLAFQRNNVKLGSLLFFYKKSFSDMQECTLCSKKLSNRFVPSSSYFIDLFNQTKKRKVGLVKFIMEFIQPLLFTLEYDLDSSERKEPFLKRSMFIPSKYNEEDIKMIGHRYLLDYQ